MKPEEPSDEEVLQKLADLGEPCNCVPAGGTALYQWPEKTPQRCPVHGEHNSYMQGTFLSFSPLKVSRAMRRAQNYARAKGTVVYG